MSKIDDSGKEEKIKNLDNYIEYLQNNENFPPKNSTLANAYNYINRNRNNKKYPLEIIERLYRIDELKDNININKRINHVTNQLIELKNFLEDNMRFPLQEGPERTLGLFLQNFPRQKNSTDEQKKMYKDMINDLHDKMVDMLLEYKEKNHQTSIFPTQKEYKEMLEHINLKHSQRKLTKEQEIKYKLLNYQKVIHESQEEHTEKLYKEFIDFVNKKKRLPERNSLIDKERNLAINVERYMNDRNKKYKFADEQKREIKNIMSKFKRNRGGVSYPELIHSIAIRKLFNGRFTLLDTSKFYYGISCDFFLIIKNKEFAFFYDGYKFHSDKVEKDRVDTEKLLKNGVTVFRVREPKLEQLKIDSDLYYEYSPKNNEKERKINVNLIANVICSSDYSDEIDNNWESICEEARRLKYNKITEANIINDYIIQSYTNHRAPSGKKDTLSDEIKVYRRLKSYMQRSHMSKLGKLIVFCVDAVYADNSRSFMENDLTTNGIDKDTLDKIKEFLTNNDDLTSDEN